MFQQLREMRGVGGLAVEDLISRDQTVDLTVEVCVCVINYIAWLDKCLYGAGMGEMTLHELKLNLNCTTID